MSWFSRLFGQAGKAQAQFVRTQRQPDGNTYDIYHAASRSAALAFLRELDLKEERRYAVVETPEGNFGKDFILIFDEKTQETIELARRKPLPRPQKSAGRCAICGYPVIPYRKTPDFGGPVGSVTTYVIVANAKKNGAGYACRSCGAISCAVCARPEKSPRCVLCGGGMAPYDE